MKTRNAMLAGAVALVLGFGLAVLLWDRGLEETRRVMLQAPHACPSGTSEKLVRAGEVGWLRFCAKGEVRHGPFVYWKNQRKYAEGVYRDGRHFGPITYFDDAGQVARKGNFSD